VLLATLLVGGIGEVGGKEEDKVVEKGGDDDEGE